MTNNALAEVRRTHVAPAHESSKSIVTELRKFDAPEWMIERARELQEGRPNHA
jgi:hypothetical protein